MNQTIIIMTYEIYKQMPPQIAAFKKNFLCSNCVLSACR